MSYSKIMMLFKSYVTIFDIFYCFISENKPKVVQDTRVEVSHSSKEIITRITVGKMRSDKNKLCNFRLKVTMDESTKWWWLMSYSIIKHNDHLLLCTEAKLAEELDLTLDKMGFIQQLYSHGVNPTIISNIMSKIAGKEFNSTTISNIERKLDQAIDEAYGIDPKITSAQKTLARLQRNERHPNLFHILKVFIFPFLF